jgi:hypothetical protein
MAGVRADPAEFQGCLELSFQFSPVLGLLLILAFPVRAQDEPAKRSSVMRRDNPMEAIQTILHPTELSEAAEPAFELAERRFPEVGRCSPPSKRFLSC